MVKFQDILPFPLVTLMWTTLSDSIPESVSEICIWKTDNMISSKTQCMKKDLNKAKDNVWEKPALTAKFEAI